MKRLYMPILAALLLSGCTIRNDVRDLSVREDAVSAAEAYMENDPDFSILHDFWKADLTYCIDEFIPAYNALGLSFEDDTEAVWQSRCAPNIPAEYTVDPASFRQSDNTASIHVRVTLPDVCMLDLPEVYDEISQIYLYDLNTWEQRTGLFTDDVPPERLEEFYQYSYSGTAKALLPLLEKQCSSVPMRTEIVTLSLVYDNDAWTVTGITSPWLQHLSSVLETYMK